MLAGGIFSLASKRPDSKPASPSRVGSPASLGRARSRQRPFGGFRLHTRGGPAHFGVEPLARRIVIGLGRGGARLVAVELVEKFEVISDRADVAVRDRARREPQRRLEPRELQQRVVRRGVDDALLEDVADDLADAPVRQSLLAGDFRIGPTLAQPREDPRAAQLPQIRVGAAALRPGAAS